MHPELARRHGTERLPRYTSYPTAPHFSASINHVRYGEWLRSVDTGQPSSLYLHVPFCRSMCWYCGCHTSVTRRDDPIVAYTAGLMAEARLVADIVDQRLPLSHIHFGGGTPTIMAPEAFAGIMDTLRRDFLILPDAEIAVEIDPRTLDDAMTEALGSRGINRASLGVQSFDPAVQRAINRLQSFDQTARSAERLRAVGVTKLNFDLLYGLPLQTVQSCLETVAKCIELRPDRLSVFGYAHVPSFKKHQRKIDEDTLPDVIERHRQSESISEALLEAGYVRVGFDHFARTDDSLAVAKRNGTLRRNFQGYTDDHAQTLIGLGASAIGRLGKGYIQNAVGTRDYLERIADGRLATTKGYAVTDDDLFRADIIEQIMCQMTVDLSQVARQHGRDAETAIIDHSRLERLIADGAAIITGHRVSVSDGAEFLARNVAATFDAHLGCSSTSHSRAV